MALSQFLTTGTTSRRTFESWDGVRNEDAVIYASKTEEDYILSELMSARDGDKMGIDPAFPRMKYRNSCMVNNPEIPIKFMIEIAKGVEPYRMEPLRLPDGLEFLPGCKPYPHSRRTATFVAQCWNESARKYIMNFPYKRAIRILIYGPNIKGPVSSIFRHKAKVSITVVTDDDDSIAWIKKRRAPGMELKCLDDIEGKYDLVIVPYHLHVCGRATELWNAVDEGGQLSAVVPDIYKVLGEDNDTDVELISSGEDDDGRWVKVKVRMPDTDAKVYVDYDFDVDAFAEEHGITCYSHGHAREYLGRAGMKIGKNSPGYTAILGYYRAVILRKVDLNLNIPLVIDKPEGEARMSDYKELHYEFFDPAIPLTLQDTTTYFPRDRYFFTEKLNGFPVTILFSKHSVEFNDRRDYNMVRTLEHEWTSKYAVVAQYELVGDKAIFRHVNAVFEDVGKLEFLPTTFNSRRILGPLHDNENWNFRNVNDLRKIIDDIYDMEGVILATAGAMYPCYSHSVGSFGKEYDRVGSMRYYKTRPTIDIDGMYNTYEVSLVDGTRTIRENKAGNSALRLAAISNMVEWGVLISLSGATRWMPLSRSETKRREFIKEHIDSKYKELVPMEKRSPDVMLEILRRLPEVTADDNAMYEICLSDEEL